MRFKAGHFAGHTGDTGVFRVCFEYNSGHTGLQVSREAVIFLCVVRGRLVNSKIDNEILRH